MVHNCEETWKECFLHATITTFKCYSSSLFGLRALERTPLKKRGQSIMSYITCTDFDARKAINRMPCINIYLL